MDRRSFLRVALIGGGATVILPQTEVFRKYFLAPKNGWNPRYTTGVIGNEYTYQFRTFKDFKSGRLYSTSVGQNKIWVDLGEVHRVDFVMESEELADPKVVSKLEYL